MAVQLPLPLAAVPHPVAGPGRARPVMSALAGRLLLALVMLVLGGPGVRSGLSLGDGWNSLACAGETEVDPRLEALRAVWPSEVKAARERLQVVTGLDLGGVDLVLLALGDEDVPFEVRTVVRDGVRHAQVAINAEPVVAGRIDLPRLLLRALGAAAHEGVAGRFQAVPPWLREMASTAAAGDLDRRLETLARAAALGDALATRVDPRDARAAAATGVAALLLLADGESPREVRRFLAFTAEGDDADPLLGRISREPGGEWVGRARVLLLDRMGRIDVTAWRLLERARLTLAEEGRAGMLAMLPESPSNDIAAELCALKAQAAAQEGDLSAARALLRELPEGADAHLQSPAEILALHAALEARSGGDAALARSLAARLDRDYPRSPHRAELRRQHPLLGLEDDPQFWLAATGTRLESDGVESLSLHTAERYARLLLMDHRAGAAERFLASLGERGQAPELLAIGAAVAEAQRDPSAAAIAQARPHVLRLEALDGDLGEAAAIRDAGAASVATLLEVLDRTPAAKRGAVVRTLAECGGAYMAVRGLVPRWERAPAWVLLDLRALLRAVPANEVQTLLPPDELRRLSAQDPERLWMEATLGLPQEWLDAQPDFLMRLDAPSYAVRRVAFEQAALAGGSVLTPQLVAHGLQDPAALLREAAAQAALHAGFLSLGRLAMDDESARVREVGVVAVAQLAGVDGIAVLAVALAEDPSQAVRRAAALALLRTAPHDAQVLDALVAVQAEEDAWVREPVLVALRQAPAVPLARAIARALRRASARERPLSAFLARITTLFQRVARVDLRYVPGATQGDLREMAAVAEQWAEREERSGPSGVSASRSGSLR